MPFASPWEGRTPVEDVDAIIEAYLKAAITEISLSVCKAYKEIPGLPTGDFDRDAIFRELVKK